MRYPGCNRRHALAALLAVGGGVDARTFEDPLHVAAPSVRQPARASLSAIAQVGSPIDHRLVAVGARGLVAASDDKGWRWHQVPVPLSSDLVAVSFVNPSLGWIAGHDGVLLNTRDGGRSWSRRLDGLAALASLREDFEGLAARHDLRAAQLLKQLAIDHANGPEQPLLDVAFDPSGRGFACGAFGLLLGSDDAGLSWHSWIERIDNPKGLHLNALLRLGDTWLIAAEQGNVFRLAAAEAQFASTPTGYAGSLFALTGNARRVVACGLRGSVLESLDAGVTWRGLVSGSNASFTAATTLDDGRTALANQAGQVIVSRRDEPGFEAPRLAAPFPVGGLAQSGDALVVVGLGGVQRMPLV